MNDCRGIKTTWIHQASDKGADAKCPAPSPLKDWMAQMSGGTSASAAIVAGMAAGLIGHNRSLSIYPEALKALIIATARNSKIWTRGSNAGGPFGDSGHGGVDATRADRVARGDDTRWGAVRGIKYGKCRGEGAWTFLGNMSLQANVKTRAVLTWGVNPNAGRTTDPYTPPPNYASPTNFVLCVDLPDGTLCGAAPTSDPRSDRWDDSYQVADFVPPVSGVYPAWTWEYQCDPKYDDDQEPHFRLGWAWTTNMDAPQNE